MANGLSINFESILFTAVSHRRNAHKQDQWGKWNEQS